MNRFIAILAALALAPAALAQNQDAAPTQASAPQAPSHPAESPADPAILEGRVESMGEQVSTLATDVSGLKKLRVSGYVQARWADQESSANDYNNDPSTAPGQQNFFIRRARFKATYDADWSQYAVQLDATPRGVLVKEAYATLKLPKGLAVDAGLQLFPFGYEVLVRSSADLDLLERSAVTRAYLAGEYDLGVALRGVYGPVNFKVGLFNGNGVDAWGFGSSSSALDNDQLKDVIGRVGFDLGFVTGGVSGWYGKAIDYTSDDDTEYDRYRVGGDLQVYLDLLPIGGTALKGEYIWGRTPIGTGGGGAGSALGKTGHGWYGAVTQNVSRWNQVAVRYEEFTRDNTMPLTGTNVKTARSVQVAVHTFVGSGYKLSGAWVHPINGERADGVSSDPETDQLIVQAQARF